jgi:hypothetical protein
MKTVRALTFSLAAAATLTVTSSALAQEPAPVVTPGTTRGGLGVGYAQMLGGPTGFAPGGIDAVYDGGKWHADAFLGAEGNGATALMLGARGWFHLHSSTNADFSLGGGLGLAYVNPDGPAESATLIEIDVGAQIRAFITQNVAVSAFMGIGILTADGDGFLLNGQPLGALGLHYYFW